MSDKQMNQLLGRIAKLEADVEEMKTNKPCSRGLIGLFGILKDNPLFPKMIERMAAERAAEREAAYVKEVRPRSPAKTTRRRVVASKR